MDKNIYVGCKEDRKEGFFHCDVKKFEHIDYVCSPWELSTYLMEVNFIYSINLLQYLTNYEADRVLRDWFKILKTNGKIEFIVPNMDYYCNLWLSAEWNEESLKNKLSDAKSSFVGFWGEQNKCDPWQSDYSTSYEDIHKSGYNEKRIKLLLERIGFVNISVQIEDEKELIVKANKPKYSGERQVGTTLEQIRKDHLNRYLFASKYITKQNSIVVDGACGVGYGSYVLAQNSNTKIVQSLDISQDAISHAKEHFNDEKIEFKIVNLENDELEVQKADYFISFETIEHLPSPEKYIEKIAKSIKDDGLFIGSTPNETIMPFIQQNFLFHTRHFTVKEIDDILKKYGFNNIQYFQQKREEPSSIEEIDDGHYIIFVAKK
ncbi:methyltransferase domain-containing protein [Arcobacter sp.]|uniref:methyltransferase domain-containing protein n=1 Tax=unclassified Arcobacter TaxID=2593671 RepID=UPI003B00E17F|eukprot:TRINITY_DN14105_c0_g1_i3.p1 TRINITY_DN14105_c0_g1~~TRINITY_DN14105_c0_g1_i3.p1  ORF type:complete len:377 (-),score=-24.33 TRINITY_DN14105_c0_g1_i3:385-1515(-)